MKVPPVELNKIYPLEITDITSSGEGVAHYKNFTVFVDDTVPGDEVNVKIDKIKPNYASAHVTELIKASDQRKEEPFCPYQEQCGGCSYSLLNYNSQLKQKQKQINDAFEKIGGLDEIEVLPVLPSKELAYRNKAQYQVRPEGIGFFKKGSHELIPISNCLLQSEKSNEILNDVLNFLNAFNLDPYNEETHDGLVRGVLIRTNNEGKASLTFIFNSNDFLYKRELVSYFEDDPDITGIYLNYNTKKGNTILGNETEELYKTEDLTEKLWDKLYRISPTAFFQVNTDQAKVLYDTVKEFADLKADDTILDLYCGTGSIGIYLAGPENELTGVEINSKAINDAIYNASLNKIRNYEYFVGKVEDLTDELNHNYDLVIVDPPRKGLDKKLIKFLLEKNFPKIIYVSCNPATLARDLKDLTKEYKIGKVQPVDLFPQTGHVETVVLLTKKDLD